MLTVGDENRTIRMVPGAFRDSADQGVAHRNPFHSSRLYCLSGFEF
jgi:hypothetical protein